jgi:hypothetical protein
MFDNRLGVGLSEELLSSGESDDHDIAYLLTCRTLADGWVEPDRDLLPDSLEELPVGPFLAAVVGAVDRSRLNGHDAIRLMQSEARLTSGFEAAKLATMAEVAHCPPGDADAPVERSPSEVEYAAVEIAAALTLTRRTAESLLETALTLTGRLRRVWNSFASGVLDMHKTRELTRQLGHLDREVVDVVLDRTLDRAPGLTTGQLRALVSRRVMEADPDGAASGLAEGLRERRVINYPNPDFTGTLSIQSASPLEVGRAMAHIENLARRIVGDDDERTLDEIRADVALDLLQGKCLCGSTGSSSGGVHLEVELATLAELSDKPGELAGYGPVIAEIARKTALVQSEGEWDYEVTDNGRVVATGTVRRRPNAAQKRHIRSVYDTCAFVGCRMPAHQCDLDHRRPYSQGGPTHNDNLAPLCRHHHITRHHAPWQLHRLPDGGHRWTSPLGHTYERPRAPPH